MPFHDSLSLPLSVSVTHSKMDEPPAGAPTMSHAVVLADGDGTDRHMLEADARTAVVTVQGRRVQFEGVANAVRESELAHVYEEIFGVADASSPTPSALRMLVDDAYDLCVVAMHGPDNGVLEVSANKFRTG